MIGNKMSVELRKELSKDYAELTKDELELRKEQWMQSLEDSEYILTILEEDLKAMTELFDIKFTEQGFKRCEPMFEYEKNPRFWDLQREIGVRAAKMEIKKKETEIHDEKQFVDIYKQLLIKTDALL
jgi:hypothetical protein